MDPGRPEDTVIQIPTGRCPHLEPQNLDPALPLHLPDQVQVLHDGHGRDPTDRFKHGPPDENGLISVGQSDQRRTNSGQELHQAKRQPLGIQPETESPTHPTRIEQAGRHGRSPGRRQFRIGVQKKDHVGLHGSPALLQLLSPTALRRQDTGAGLLGLTNGPVLAARIYDDHLNLHPFSP